ncbi:Gfo/Idh/MocA family oxidoreductase [bacterium]|jgi:myo-inositol 2-dehydrogenase / D-chiro-inositol 1-dehydrogenase|nr:Gfo/Idh/MocA family oxidoreductase [bacterium]MDA7680275.1 Gfo/Idh/MocA family oxidoreductase [bacterium]MDB4798156.1 Gfo/Idh/MocA family oxidoreductase [Verrucomicrobiota bacterium]
MASKGVYRVLALSVVKHDYLPRAVAAHPQFQLVGVADHPGESDWVHARNQAFAEEFGIPYVKDVDQALHDLDAEVAVVSSQAERHCELGVRAANAGLHVILDKPLALRLSDADQLVESVLKNQVQSLVWNRNYLPSLVQAKATLDAGKIGRLLSVHCDFYFSKDAGPSKGSRGPNDPPINWLERQIEAHADGSDGGVGVEPMGELQIEGIYPLGYINLLAGSPVERVFARTAAHFHQANVDNQVEDLATVTLEMRDGIVGSLSIGRIGAAAHPDIGEIKLHMVGTDGALVVSEARPEVSVYYRGQAPLEFKHRRVADQNNFRLMEEFAQAIEGNAKPVLDVLEARNITATVLAALESNRTGQVVSVENREI